MGKQDASRPALASPLDWTPSDKERGFEGGVRHANLAARVVAAQALLLHKAHLLIDVLDLVAELHRLAVARDPVAFLVGATQ